AEAPGTAEDDLRVAGAPERPGAGVAGDTGELPPFEPGHSPSAGFPGATEVISSDEPAGRARRPRQARRSGGRRPASVSGPSRSGSPRSGASGRTGMKIAAIAAGAVVVLGGGGAAAYALTGSGKSEAAGSDKTTVAAGPAKAAMPPLDPAKVEAQRKKLAIDRASRANRDATGDKIKLMPKGKPVPTPTKSADSAGGDKGGSGGGGGPSGDPVPAGTAQQIAKTMLPSYGFSGSGQFGCLVKLWNKESGWNTHASNPTSGAYGIPQALPGSKMASAGSDWQNSAKTQIKWGLDWQNSAKTQIKWGLGYIKGRYGTPCGAWAHSQSVGWY
ncbi:aggregation-promoting factor C-terminal-like domain-containing protein, partial [Actinomadura logoneensis]|uniref:aggregation-promoting factor C-terminal-like domain-containing protein n=1 Tax=Actinomadura logoneensis TaxID=2293572 RepID=UPI002E268111